MTQPATLNGGTTLNTRQPRILFSGQTEFEEFYKRLGFREVKRIVLRLSADVLVELPIVAIGARRRITAPYFSALFMADQALVDPIILETCRSDSDVLTDFRYSTSDICAKVDSSGKSLAILNIENSLDAQIGKMSKRMRSRFRRAIESTWTVEVADNSEVGEFSRLYFEHMRRLGSPALPKRFFDNFLRSFALSELVVCRDEGGACLGGAINLAGQDYLENFWMATVPAKGAVSPSLKIYAFLIERAVNCGLPTLGFGRSTIASGVEGIKTQLGCAPYLLIWRSSRSGFGENLWESRAGTGVFKFVASRIFRLGPKPITRRSGAWLSQKVY